MTSAAPRRVCVTAKGPSLDSPLDPRFGRAVVLLVVDLETGQLEPLPSGSSASHGAGIQAAQAVIQSGAQVLITGHVGPKAFEVLDAGGVRILVSSAETVGQAVDEYRTGRLG